MSDPNTDRYSIEIKNLTTGEIVILTAVEMTDNEKSVVVRNYFGFLAHRQHYG